jgi:hypothetical protein
MDIHTVFITSQGFADRHWFSQFSYYFICDVSHNSSLVQRLYKEILFGHEGICSIWDPLVHAHYFNALNDTY